MRLTRYTDYSMRVLMYLAAKPDRICTIPEMARVYGISQNHLMKIVHQLGKAGYVTGVRGRYGGVRLARPADTINVGAVIRFGETQPGAEGLALLDCPECPIAPACGLTGVVDEALAAFFTVLERYTLADLVAQRSAALQDIFATKVPIREIDPVAIGAQA
jgi:Rrf2 family nitric oxide-sensitive transcriptional repressor